MNKAYKTTIYVTDEYEKLKTMVGNRDVDEKRVRYIIKSIESVGYISNPILVNEKLEVIDGQGRLEALKRLNMPIEYRIVSGLTVNECRMMNLENCSWKVDDHIKSHADIGETEYVNWKRLRNKYGFSTSVMMSVLYGRGHSGYHTNKLRYNQLVLTAEQIVRLDKDLEYLSALKDIKAKIGGSNNIFYPCIAWAIHQDGVDAERIKESLLKYYREIDPALKEKFFLEDLSKVYNKGLTKDKRRHFAYEWEMK